MDESATLLMCNLCVFFSYSGFPVLNAELCVPQEGPGIHMATSNSRHTSPGSPAAIFRRSKQVCVTYPSLYPNQTAWLLLLLLFKIPLTQSYTLSLSFSDHIPLSGDKISPAHGQDILIHSSHVVQVSAAPLPWAVVYLPASLCSSVPL